jgi:hypothetical protein
MLEKLVGIFIFVAWVVDADQGAREVAGVTSKES